MASGPINSWQIDGETVETVTDFIFLASKITADGDCSHEVKWLLCLGRKSVTILDNILKSRDITLPTKVLIVKTMAFPVVMYESETWTIKNTERQRIEFFWNVLLANTLESPLGCKKIHPVNPKGNQLWIFTGRTEAETPILWPPDAKRQFIRKDPDTGKDWRQEEKGMPEDEMVGWHHQLNGHEIEQALGDGQRQGRLECYSPWGCKQLDTTEQLKNNRLNSRLI